MVHLRARLRQPDGKVAGLMVLLLVLLLSLWFLTGKFDGLVALVGLVGGWGIAFLSAYWNAQATLIENARVTAYRELGNAISPVINSAAKLGVDLRKELTYVPDFAPSLPRNGFVMPAVFRSQWVEAETQFIKFLTLWQQSDLLFPTATSLFSTLYSELDKIAHEWTAYSDHLDWFFSESTGKESDWALHRALSGSMADNIQRGVHLLVGFQRELQAATFEPLLGVGARDGVHPGQLLLKVIHSKPKNPEK